MKELSSFGLVSLSACIFALIVLVWGGIQHMLDSLPMGEEDETGFHLIDENKNEVLNQEEVERTLVHGNRWLPWCVWLVLRCLGVWLVALAHPISVSLTYTLTVLAGELFLIGRRDS